MHLLLRQFKIEGAVQNSHSAHKIWSQKMQSESPAPASAVVCGVGEMVLTFVSFIQTPFPSLILIHLAKKRCVESMVSGARWSRCECWLRPLLAVCTCCLASLFLRLPFCK